MKMKDLKVNIINNKGEVAGEKVTGFNLPERMSLPLLAQAVRVFLSNQRKAYAKTKTRGEVAGSTIKVWKQKGTGRARHGARKAPIFVGGGVVFGPTGGQNYKMKLSKPMREKALLTVIAGKMEDKTLYLAKGIDFKKTKEASEFIKNIRKNLGVKGDMALLLSGKEKTQRIFRNLEGISIINSGSLNVYSLLKADFLLVSEPALQDLNKHFGFSVKEDDAVKH